jgi:hypothetical protein
MRASGARSHDDGTSVQTTSSDGPLQRGARSRPFTS